MGGKIISDVLNSVLNMHWKYMVTADLTNNGYLGFECVSGVPHLCIFMNPNTH